MKILTMKSFTTNGRLGNQLFQFASMLGLAIKHTATLTLPKWPYTPYFAHEEKINTICSGENIPTNTEAKEQTFHYVKEWSPINQYSSVDVWGYLQSFKYWEHCEVLLRTMFTFKAKFVEHCKQSVGFSNLKAPIAISIRRGDYVNNPNYHLLPVAGYFFNALNAYFPDWLERDIIVFSDDIPYCRCHFATFPNVTYSENNTDIEDLCLMSQCDDFIIGNSTFSFWGAYLANRGKVVRPAHHFNGDLKQRCDIKDYYPSEWVVFDHLNEDGTEKRLDLFDTTFIIPVSYDHEDRKENLNLVLRFLKRNFNTTVIVMEQHSGDAKFSYLKNKSWHGCSKYMEFIGVDFHRTRMLNLMTKEADTKYIFNWDADVLIPPLQIFQAVALMRAGNPFVFPYAWAFARMPRNTWYAVLRDYEDIGMVKTTVFNGMNLGDATSLGGAFGFEKEAYRECGLENENFISYGAEDVERVLRLKKLGRQITRVPGPNMYHLNHFVGPNSSRENPFFASNERALQTIRDLSALELAELVNTWGQTK